MFKKNIKPILMAGALALATAVSPVFAVDGGNQDVNPTYVKSITVNKTLTLPAGIESLPAQAFNFTVTATGNNASIAPTPTVGTVNIAKANTTGGVGTSFSGNAVISFAPAQGTIPGNYTYTLTETNESKPGITYDTAQYTIEVQVINADENNPGTVVVSNACVVKTVIEDGKTKNEKTSADFTNAYNEEATLKVEKQVKGKGAHADSFDFVIDLTLPENFTKTLPDNTETCEFDIAPSVSTDSDKDAGSQVQFNYGKVTFNKETDGTYKAQLTGTLADDGIVIIKGLPVGTTYKVSEKDTDYVETVNVSTNSSMGLSVGTMTVGQKSVKSKFVEGTIIDTGVTVDQDENVNTVTFTNTKDSSPLTGVIVNNMPYIALLGASGAGLVVLAASKKRSKK